MGAWKEQSMILPMGRVVDRFCINMNLLWTAKMGNLIPSSLVDEAEGEIWSNLICTRDHQSGMWQAIKERMLEINPQFYLIINLIWIFIWTELLKTLQRKNCTRLSAQETTLMSFTHNLANQDNWIFLLDQISPSAS